MAMPRVLTFGQYPIQGLGSYHDGGAEEEKPSSMRFTLAQVNEALGDPNYLCCNQNVSEQDGEERVVPEKFSFIFPKEGKYPESEFAEMANPNFGNVEYDLEKETGVLTVDINLTMEQRQHYRTLNSI